MLKEERKKYGMKACRVDVDLTQKEIADKLGISRMEYSNWENKKIKKEMKKYQKIAFAHLVGEAVENIRW